jgi:hypothetical protein
MDQVPGTQMILADNYVHDISTCISTAAQVSAPQLCIHLMYIILQIAQFLKYTNPQTADTSHAKWNKLGVSKKQKNFQHACSGTICTCKISEFADKQWVLYGTQKL